MKYFVPQLALICAAVVAQAQTTIYKPGAQGAYGTGGSYVAPATTKSYGSPPPRSSTPYTPPASRSSAPSYRSSTPSSSDRPTRYSDGSSSSSDEANKKPSFSPAEMAAYNEKMAIIRARVEQEEKELSNFPLFCRACKSANIAQDINTYMYKYPTPERYIERVYVPQIDIEALEYVSTRINADQLNSIPKADALAFMDRLHWQISHLNQFGKRDQLNRTRTLVIQRFAGIAPPAGTPSTSGVRKIVMVDSHYGYEDEFGTIVIPALYDGAYNFNKGGAMVKKNGKYGFIDSLGKVVVPIEYINPVGMGTYVELERNGIKEKFESGGKKLD